MIHGKEGSKDIDSFYQLFGAEIEYNMETENKNPLVVVYGALAAAVDAAFLHAPSNTDAMYVIHNLLNKKLTDLLDYERLVYTPHSSTG